MAKLGPLDEFASASTVEAQSEALLELLKNKDLHRALDTPAFASGLQRLVHYSEDTSAGPSRLIALSTLGRIGAVAKAAQPMIAQRLARALEQPLPDLQLLDDSDGRFYVAGMWRYTRHEWMPAYLAEADRSWMLAGEPVQFKLAPKLPKLVEEKFDSVFQAEYQKLTVALGGALPQQLDERAAQKVWHGDAPPPGPLSRYQTKGL